MNSVSPIFITTTIISRYKNGNVLGSATGFFFEDTQKNIFLVTNKHVLYGKEYSTSKTIEIDQVKLRLHVNPNNLEENEELEVNLVEGDEKKWLEHDNADIDVILIPVDIKRDRYVITTLNESHIKSSGLEVGFEKLFVMGYPYGWYDQINNLPVVRIGHLSSPFKIPFKKYPIMLGDVETHPGMSGGPVFIELKDFVTYDGKNKIKNMGSSRLLLVGIHSGQPIWNVVNKETQEREDIKHSLVIIWFPELIMEILDKSINIKK